MHKLIVLYFLCLVGIVQSSNCSNLEPKSSLVKTATQIARHLVASIKGINKDAITENFLTEQITNKFKGSGIKDVFKLQDFCGYHQRLVTAGLGFVTFSCLYTTYRAIKCTRKCTRKYARKTKK